MALRINNSEITSDVTEHCARRTKEGWEVSWLPDRQFDQNSAVTAMMLVEIYVTDPPPWSEIWSLAAQWEREIGVDRRRDWL